MILNISQDDNSGSFYSSIIELKDELPSLEELSTIVHNIFTNSSHHLDICEELDFGDWIERHQQILTTWLFSDNITIHEQVAGLFTLDPSLMDIFISNINGVISLSQSGDDDVTMCCIGIRNVTSTIEEQITKLTEEYTAEQLAKQLLMSTYGTKL